MAAASAAMLNQWQAEIAASKDQLLRKAAEVDLWDQRLSENSVKLATLHAQLRDSEGKQLHSRTLAQANVQRTTAVKTTLATLREEQRREVLAGEQPQLDRSVSDVRDRAFELAEQTRQQIAATKAALAPVFVRAREIESARGCGLGPDRRRAPAGVEQLRVVEDLLSGLRDSIDAISLRAGKVAQTVATRLEDQQADLLASATE